MSSVRSLVRDQENQQVTFHSKNGTQGRSNGPAAKGLKFKSGLETPRRALGDVGNIFKTPAKMAEKPSMLKSNQQHTLKSFNKRSSALDKGSHIKQRSCSRTIKKDVTSSSLQDREISYEREKMIPYIDDDPPLPRSKAIKSVLQNVSQLYRGCLQPSYCKPIYLEPKLETDMEYLQRPESTHSFCWLPPQEDSFFEISSLPLCDDIELPAVDTSLSGLGLP